LRTRHAVVIGTHLTQTKGGIRIKIKNKRKEKENIK
jgi:hypothetical protein